MSLGQEIKQLVFEADGELWGYEYRLDPTDIASTDAWADADIEEIYPVERTEKVVVCYERI